VGDFPQDLEPLDYSPDRLYPKFIIRKINCGEVVFPVTSRKNLAARMTKQEPWVGCSDSLMLGHPH